MSKDIESILSDNFYKVTEVYKNFARRKSACIACPLYEEYKQVLQAEGNADNPRFVFIGEAYGADELRLDKPFVGRAGQRLRKELRKHIKVFNRSTTLITNLLACRPRENKFPDWDKIAQPCANRWLRLELNLLNPPIIITLGAQSLRYIRQRRISITQSRGDWFYLHSYKAWTFATYHPSYVLRKANDPDSNVEQEFEEDIKKIANTWATIIGNDYRVNKKKKPNMMRVEIETHSSESDDVQVNHGNWIINDVLMDENSNFTNSTNTFGIGGYDPYGIRG